MTMALDRMRIYWWRRVINVAQLLHSNMINGGNDNVVKCDMLVNIEI